MLLSVKNYKNWIDSSFEEPVDPQILFNMGKCQGIMETTGKVMLTLCMERKRNVNINKQLAANLEGIRTISLVKEYVISASKISNLQEYNAQELLSIVLSVDEKDLSPDLNIPSILQYSLSINPLLCFSLSTNILTAGL